jgi:transcriptional regulator with XRE-family HTH domain
MSIIPAQIRAARSLVNWSQQQLADAAEVAISSVRDIEGERRAGEVGTVSNVRLALESAGVEFIPGTAEQGPGVRLVGNRPNLIRRPTVLTKWDGLPVEVEFKGNVFTAFVSREAIEDLGELKGNEPVSEWLAVFDRYSGSILDAIRGAYSNAKNWDRQEIGSGFLRVTSRYIRELR